MELKLNNVRIAFCNHLLTPGANKPTDKPKYSAIFIFPKDDPQNAKVMTAIDATAKAKWGEKAPLILKSLRASGDICYRDGDTKAQYDGFDGMMYISASARDTAKTKPKVISANKIDGEFRDLKEGEVYGGCYVNVKVDFWAQDNSFGKKINAELKVVQFAKDGDAFNGSAAPTTDDFDDISDTGADDGSDLV